MTKKPKFPVVNHREILKTVPSGQIVSEMGSDGTWIRFECDCLDALPYCKSACCSLYGIGIEEDEKEQLDTVAAKAMMQRLKLPSLPILTETDVEGEHGLRRMCDGACICLDRQTRLCHIYEHRPATCRDFHCTRNAGNRGFRLEFARLKEYDE